MLDVILKKLAHLKPAGHDGFEGLVGEILLGITGIPSRLAKSGTQFGIDGDSAFPGDAISFEAKLYTKSSLKKNEIVTKVAELGIYKEAADLLWVLGATTPVASQDASLLHERASLDGTSVLILDWNSHGLPTLAVALAMARKRVITFLDDILNIKRDENQLTDALDWVQAHKDYELLSKKLLSQFDAVGLATENAGRANKEWLRSVFSEKGKARNTLGQPVAPLHIINNVLPRNLINNEIEKQINEDPKTLFLLGEEGCGKSWVAASLMNRFSGISIFISAENLEGVQASEEDLTDLLVRILASQCEQLKNDPVVVTRWNKRLEGWKYNLHPSRLLVVLDGLNQRPLLNWHKIINVLQYILSRLGGCLVVTSRPRLFHTQIKQGLVEAFWQLPIGNWSEAERNQLLEANGISINSLDPVTVTSLLNPRLLGIALEVLPLDELEAWEGLTTDRLLFEHLRLSQRDQIEPERSHDLARKISSDASKTIEKFKDVAHDKIPLLHSDTEYVAEGRFYEVIEGPGRRYRLREEGLTLAFGYALVDRIWEANYAGEDLNEALAKLMEPISALDRTAEVLLAGLTVCAFDEGRFKDNVFIAILDSFTSLQNINSQKYLSFRDICYTRFNAFLISLECCFLGTNNKINSDWLKAVALDAKYDSKRWGILSNAINRWFSYYSEQPEYSLKNYPQSQKDEFNKKVKEKEEKITEALDSLSPFESELLAEMEKNNGNLNQLTSLAIELLADKPLAPFARSFVKWGISAGINSSHWSPESEFRHLTNFNQVDWQEMCTAFSQAIFPLDSDATSRGGLWTKVRILRATGTHNDAIKADEITEYLRSGEQFKGWRSVEKYCAVDPCDPNSEKPDNIEATSKQFQEIDVDQLYVGDFLETNGDGRFLKISLLGMARFYPDIAVSKHKELLATWPLRTGKPLEQLSLNGEALIPLISPSLAEDLFNELVEGKNFKTLLEDDRLVVLQVLWFISNKIQPHQQLEIMLIPDPECNGYLMDMTSNFKPFEPTIFSSKFSDICSTGKTEAIIAALAFLRYTSTKRNDTTNVCLLELFSHPDTRVRACVFDTISNKNIKLGIEKLYKSCWSANKESVKQYEEFYGSWVLIKAYKLGIATFPEIFERCSIKVLIASITSFHPIEQQVIAESVNSAFNCLIKKSDQIEKPVFDVTFRENEYGGPPYSSLDGLKHLHQKKHLPSYETHEEFVTRQRLLGEAFDKFEAELDPNIALFILNLLQISDVENISNIAPELIRDWSKQLQQTNNPYFADSLCYLVATVVSKQTPAEAKKLFIKAGALDSFVNITYRNGLTLQRKAIWSSSRDGALEDLRISRLNNAVSDHEIAMEVLAAETFDRGDLIAKYVYDALSKKHPYIKARAIMIAGFSNQTDLFSEQLIAAAQESGLLGNVARTALEAHQRCCWSKHWAKKMINAKSAEDFWCSSLLLAKTVDGRIELLLNAQTSFGHYWTQYQRAIAGQTKARAKKWETKRKETFLGMKSVNKSFM